MSDDFEKRAANATRYFIELLICLIKVGLAFTIIAVAYRIYKSSLITLYNLKVYPVYAWAKILSSVGLGKVDIEITNTKNEIIVYDAQDIIYDPQTLDFIYLIKNEFVEIFLSTLLIAALIIVAIMAMRLAYLLIKFIIDNKDKIKQHFASGFDEMKAEIAKDNNLKSQNQPKKEEVAENLNTENTSMIKSEEIIDSDNEDESKDSTSLSEKITNRFF